MAPFGGGGSYGSVTGGPASGSVRRERHSVGACVYL